MSDKVTLSKLQEKLSNFNVQQEFHKFFRHRTDSKNRLYFYIIIVGLLMTALFAYVSLNVGIYANTYDGIANSSNPVWIIVVFLVSSQLRVFGICLYSTVPVDEYDIFRQLLLAKNSHFKFLICIGLPLTIVVQSYGTIFGTPAGLYFSWYLLFGICPLFGISPDVTYDTLVLGVNLFFIGETAGQTYTSLMSIPSSVDQIPGFLPPSALYFQGALLGITSMFQFMYVVFGIYQRRAGKGHVLPVATWRLFKSIDSSHCKNYGAFEFSVIVYALLISYSLSFLCNAIVLFILRPQDNLAAVTYFIGAFLDILPMLLVACFTPEKCFTLMARVFEDNLKQRQIDGAMMSALIESCQDFSSKKIWLKRRIPLVKGSFERKDVWIEGTLKLIDETEMIEFDFKSDINMDISGQVRPSFEEWVDDNFIQLGQQLTSRYISENECKEVAISKDMESEVVKITYITSRVWLKRHVNKNQESSTGNKEDEIIDEITVMKGDHINRAVWMEGTSEVSGTIETIIIDYQSDIPYYLESLRLRDDSKGKPKCNCPFEEWLQSNFDQENITEKESEKEVVIIKRKIFEAVKSSEDLYARQDVLKDWSEDNLRAYQWKGLTDEGEQHFKDEFLKQSPRFMSAADKKATYQVSDPFKAANNQKIDFFISHSWSDSPEWKKKSLIKFSDDFKAKHGRYPTFWFDKLCLDQSNPG